MKKNIVTLILIFATFFLNGSVIFASDDFIFESNGDGTCKIAETGTFEGVTELSVPLTSVSGEQITELEDYSLYKCEAETVTLSGLNGKLNDDILEYAECKNLVIEDCNLIIGSSFASNMEDVETLTITNCELEFDDYAFYKLGDDATVNVSNSKLNFGDDAFEYSGIKEVSIDSCEINTGSSFFSNSEDVTSFIMKDSPCEFGEYAFYKLGDKTTVTITGCTGKFDADAFEYAEVTELSIDDCELDFDDSAFSNNDKMEKVQIGNGKYSFGEYGFYKCEKATEFVIGGESEDNEYEIDDSFGEYSSDLTTINLGPGKFEIGSSFFSSCKSLTNVIINDNSELQIDEYAFYNSPDELSISYQNQMYDIDTFTDLMS